MERRRDGDVLTSYCPRCGDAPAKRDRSGTREPEIARRRSPSEGSSKRDREPKQVETPPLHVPADAELFPFETVRPAQDDLMADCREVVVEGGHLVAYAPTGLGKTVASLVPAIEEGVAEGKRIFFLTGTQAQHRIAIETLKAIRDRADLDLIVADVIGKQSMCARDESDQLPYRRFSEFCRREQANGTCSFWESDPADAVAHLRRDVVPVEESVQLSTHRFGVCPHEAALDLAAQAHVVVCDYNYFFSDMGDPMGDRLQVDRDETILVVDEAHNLPDRVRDHLAVRLTPATLTDAIEELKDLDAQGEPTDHVVKALEAVEDLLEETAPDADEDEVEVPADSWVEDVDARLARDVPTLTGLDYEGLLDEVDGLIEAFEQAFKEDSRGLAMVREFLRNWRIDRRGLVRYASREVTPSLVYQLLDPRILSRPVFDEVHASVLMSGTLYPMRMYRDVLGLEPDRTRLRAYPDPFPDENRLVVVDREVTTKYEARDPAMWRRVADRIASVAEATPGNVAAFFTSYSILDRVRENLPRALTSKELVVERRAQDKADKEAIVDGLRGGSDMLMLGVLGGSLSEGIDYRGNILETVAVVGVPFAKPTLSTEALIDHYEEIFGGQGYPYAYLYPALNRVLQAAGRPIRSAEDRAAIVLMDERFAWKRYRSSLPDDLDLRVVDDPARAVRRFWSDR